MDLLEINGDGEVVVKPEARFIPEFAAIIDRDNSPSKLDSLKELGFLWWYSNYKSPYIGMSDNQKLHEARGSAGLPESWEFDSVIKEAVKKYESFDTPLIGLLKASYVLVNKLREEFLSVDLDERDEKGKKVNDSSKAMGNLKSLGGVVSGLDTLLQQVKKEQATKSRSRGGGEEGAFELPD